MNKRSKAEVNSKPVSLKQAVEELDRFEAEKWLTGGNPRLGFFPSNNELEEGLNYDRKSDKPSPIAVRLKSQG